MCGNRATGVPTGTYGSGSGAGNPTFRMLYNTFHGSWGRDCRAEAGVGCLVGICEAVGSGCPAMAVSADIWQVDLVVWRRPYGLFFFFFFLYSSNPASAAKLRPEAMAGVPDSSGY